MSFTDFTSLEFAVNLNIIFLSFKKNDYFLLLNRSNSIRNYGFAEIIQDGNNKFE